ncbi:MAG: hypothetical protein WBX12_16315 [Candidatus Acidiferrales bacterium]
MVALRLPSKQFFRSQWILLLLVALWVITLILAIWLVHHQRHLPVGVYIAVGGIAAAGMAARGERAGGFEKGAWIVLITILMAAEIQNLSRADRQQTQTFCRITQSLEQTKSGLDGVSQKLQSTANDMTLQFKLQRARDDAMERLSAYPKEKDHFALQTDIENLGHEIRARDQTHKANLYAMQHAVRTFTMQATSDHSPQTQQGLQQARTDLDKENGSYELEFYKDIQPRLMEVLRRLSFDMGLKEDDQKIAERFGLTDAASAEPVIEKADALAKKLRP